MKVLMLIAALCLALAVTACGDDSTTAGSTSQATAAGDDSPAGAGTEPAVDAAEGGGEGEGEDAPVVKPPASTETQSPAEARKRSEPKVSPPGGPPPEDLVVEDLILGSGKPAKLKDDLSTHFVAVHLDGKIFESIWAGPFFFELGPKDVNPGWVEGLPGMRAGGRRRLVVPADMTSRTGVPPSEAGPDNSALVYVVDLLTVK